MSYRRIYLLLLLIAGTAVPCCSFLSFVAGDGLDPAASVNLFVGLSMALPLYHYLRHRAIGAD